MKICGFWAEVIEFGLKKKIIAVKFAEAGNLPVPKWYWPGSKAIGKTSLICLPDVENSMSKIAVHPRMLAMPAQAANQAALAGMCRLKSKKL